MWVFKIKVLVLSCKIDCFQHFLIKCLFIYITLPTSAFTSAFELSIKNIDMGYGIWFGTLAAKQDEYYKMS